MTEPDENETADACSDTESSENDSDRSIFTDLVDRVEERRLQREARRSGSDPTNPKEEDNQSSQVDPLDRVRELIPEGLPPPPIEPKLNLSGRDSSGSRKFYAGIVLGVVIALVLPGIVVATAGHVTDTVLAPSPSTYVSENDTLYLESDDATYLSRIFRETTHEVAYCGLITHDEDRPTLTVWMANTINAGPEQIVFITENCPDAMSEVLIHTHPSGSLQLSGQDKQTLAERPEKFTCVQAGPIEADPGREAENFACYKQLESPDDRLTFERLRVVVV